MTRTVSRASIILLAITAAFALPVEAQSASSRRPSRILGESAPEFTRVLSAVELAGDLVVAVDSRERSASIVDLRSGELREFTRSGAGPRELGLPWRLVSLPGDSAVIIDAQHARALVVRPDGSPGALVQVPDGPSAHSLGARASSARIVRDGGVVFETSSGGSLNVVRQQRSQPTQTIAPLLPNPDPSSPVVQRTGNPEVVRRADPGAGNIDPYPYPHELWEAAPDGWVAIVSRTPYRVIWYSPSGERRVGPVIAVESRAVTPATRDSLAADHVRDAPAFGASRVGRYRWPAQLPAFAIGRAPTLFIDPVGRVWVRRLHTAEEAPLYDVFDRTGTRVQQVRLEANERLVGFGRASLLVVVRNADDLEAIRRVRFVFRPSRAG